MPSAPAPRVVSPSGRGTQTPHGALSLLFLSVDRNGAPLPCAEVGHVSLPAKQLNTKTAENKIDTDTRRLTQATLFLNLCRDQHEISAPPLDCARSGGFAHDLLSRHKKDRFHHNISDIVSQYSADSFLQTLYPQSHHPQYGSLQNPDQLSFMIASPHESCSYASL